MEAPHPSLESVTTIRADGSRPYLYPADIKGRFSAFRRWTGYALIVFYFSLPWIPVNGYPAVFLDVADRRFHLFGITLAAQDLWLLFFLITGLGFSLFLVTALLGRVWCGWACPQTVFLDHVYRRIERWIDGDAAARRRLAAAPLTASKVWRRVVKHTLYLAVSAIITHLFLAYFVSLSEVWTMMRTAPVEHWSAFAFIAVSTGILYFNFAWFREQLCIVICPYGRLQSVLIDDNSLVIGYDTARGEPRGRLQNRAAPETSDVARRGDCVDCERCVQVCPTGIDIRQGLQMECIGCTACIDACDAVMDRIHRPRGLIRYASQNAFSGQATRWIRPRTGLYAVLLVAGIAALTWALSTVHAATFGVTRIPGAPYIDDSGFVRNQFLVRIVNKRTTAATFQLQLRDVPSDVLQSGFAEPVVVGPLGEEVRPIVLRQPDAEYQGSFDFVVSITDTAGGYTLEREVDFLGPEPGLVHDRKERESDEDN